MKKAFVLTTLSVVLVLLVFLVCGCGDIAQPGETAAEGHRRHLRNISLNQKNLNRDIDKAFLADEPSKLSDKKIY